jgi:hypothetical protein
MKKIPLLVGAILVLALISIAPSAPKPDASALQFGEVSLSKTGVLSLQGQSARYILVPEDKYPGELRGLALIDLNAHVYVARFFVPGGIGVEGFFDICFQVKDTNITSALVENAGSLERINGTTCVRSCSYVFDSEKGMLFKTDSTEAIPTGISLTSYLKSQ